MSKAKNFCNLFLLAMANVDSMKSTNDNKTLYISYFPPLVQYVWPRLQNDLFPSPAQPADGLHHWWCAHPWGWGGRGGRVPLHHLHQEDRQCLPTHVGPAIWYFHCDGRISFVRRCAGSLISPEWVLTSAFCVTEVGTYSVGLNMSDKTSQCDNIYKVNRCLARYSPRATTTNRPTTGHSVSLHGMAQIDQKCQFWAKFGRFWAKNPFFYLRNHKLCYPHNGKPT